MSSESIGNHKDLSLFQELLAVPAPSGREEGIAEIIRGKLETWGYAHETDGAGNVLVRLEGSAKDAPVWCLAAHMDEIGMVVTVIDADGSLRVQRSGGLLISKIGERPVEIMGDNETLIGVLSLGSAHSKSGADRGKTWEDVRILTGLSEDALRSAGVRPGTRVVLARQGLGPVLFGDKDDPMVAAWTFDDRMGVVVLLLLLEKLRNESLRPYHPTIVAFTVREEVGGHGAKVLARTEQPEVFIAIDGCPMTPGAPLQLDGRPGIWARDRFAYSDERLVRDLCKAAKRAGTELQTVVYDRAASDASMVLSTGGAHRIVTLGQVRENSHGYEVARLSVFDNLLRTLVQFVTSRND